MTSRMRKKDKRTAAKGGVTEFIERNYRHFNSLTLKNAAAAYKAHMHAGGKMFLSMAGAMSTAELGITLAEMIRGGKIHAISCTGANLEEDIFNLVANREYVMVPEYRDLTPLDERRLLKRNLNRVTDTCIPGNVMRKVEGILATRWKHALKNGKRKFPHEFLYEALLAGDFKRHYQIAPADSWLLAAAEKNIPLFVPGWEDSTLGNVYTAQCLKKQLSPSTIKSGIEYMMELTGWYEKTGDWQVSRKRFPKGLGPIKARLDKYGMRLGLWFDPLAAAVSSRLARNHSDCVLTWHDRPHTPEAVWETEASHRMCLVSRYADAFADELIRAAREWGVTYFKWDAIHQYGCDDPNHQHGGASLSPAERADAYAFRIGLAMNRIADRLCAACPEAIVDFDITEGSRFVGLGFLAAGKYFLINNGPYLHNFNIPFDRAATWSNIFVHPGPARGWICRTPLTFDKWIPSVLFLTHYLPDDPAPSQLINIGSLILGQNGIWGDLLGVSDEGVALFNKWMGLYKQVRDDITRSDMARIGSPGGSPEIYEKINPATGCGAVVAFASAAGRFDYVTRLPVSHDYAATAGVELKRDARGRGVLRFDFDGDGARFVLFGTKQTGEKADA